MKKIIIIGIFLSLIFAKVSIAEGNYPPNGKRCEVAGKVIYVDKSCVTNLDWREMLWEFENNPEIFIGSVSENCVDSGGDTPRAGHRCVSIHQVHDAQWGWEQRYRRGLLSELQIRFSA